MHALLAGHPWYSGIICRRHLALHSERYDGTGEKDRSLARSSPVYSFNQDWYSSLAYALAVHRGRLLSQDCA